MKRILVCFWVFAFSSFACAMQYVQVCTPQRGCRQFSRLVMGTDHLSQGAWTADGQREPTRDEVYAVLDEAARLGINLFDTAPIYVGSVENLLGDWRRSRLERMADPTFYLDPQLNPDRKLYALSKGGFPFDLSYLKKLPAGCHSVELVNALKSAGVLDKAAQDWHTRDYPLTNVPPGTYASHLYCDKNLMIQRIAEELGHTCHNLGCNIDVYLMHRDDFDALGFKRVARAQTPVERILEAVSSPEIAGHVGFVGWSNWTADRIEESLALAQSNGGFTQPAISSPYFSLFEMGEPGKLEMAQPSIHAVGVQVTHAQMMDYRFLSGIKIMPYSPLGGFSILDQPEPVWENAKHFAYGKFLAGDPYWQNVYPAIFTAANEARWNRAKAFLVKFNAKHETRYTMDQLLNAYVLAHPRTDMLAVGAITVEQVRRTVAALEMARFLTPQDLEFLYSGGPPCGDVLALKAL